MPEIDRRRPTRVFLSFADSRFQRSRKRIIAQVSELDAFDRVLVLDEWTLERSFVRRNPQNFRRRIRGFGYWLWKPYLIERELKRLGEGDVLVYSDIGNHFDVALRSRLDEYIALAEAAETSVVSPTLSARYPEIAWTKRELLDHFGLAASSDLLKTPQRESNFIIVINNDSGRRFVRAWNEVYESSHALFNDDLSLPQNEAFSAHRHDQSALSLLSKMMGGDVIPSASDDLVLRKRDRDIRQRYLRYAGFLAKNGLVLDHLRARGV